MQLALFQGIAKKHRAATTIEMKASENPVLQNIQADPTIVCTSFKKNRFYMVCGSTKIIDLNVSSSLVGVLFSWLVLSTEENVGNNRLFKEPEYYLVTLIL